MAVPQAIEDRISRTLKPGPSHRQPSRKLPEWVLRPSKGSALVGGISAALVAAASMSFVRSVAGVRTVPERVMEWILLFVPVDVFEAGLTRFGFEAKRYGLYAAVAGFLAILTALGAVALYRGWSNRALAALGVALWLFVMVVIMPVTGGGLFGTEIINGTRMAILGYLVTALLYAETLVLCRLLLTRARHQVERAPLATRRTALALFGGAAGASLGLVVVGISGPTRNVTTIRVLDPQEPVPSGGIDLPNPHPEHSSPPPPQPVVATPVAVQQVVDSRYPEPPPARKLERDKDGAVLASGRVKGELATAITSNTNFYIVSKNAGGDPTINVRDWRLRVDGEVRQSFELDYVSLRNLPPMEFTKTLECISNFVTKCELAPFGCDLISTARWKGVRLRDVLSLAGGPKPSAAFLAVISADEYTTALPIEVALHPDTLLAYEMNGEVLPREHGFPVRLLVPGRYGMKNPKWVVALRPMSREFVDWYGQRNWSKQGFVKTMSRIDTPAPDATLTPGTQRIAGIAYGGDRGISRVEFSPDGGGSWQQARLLEQGAGRDAWVRWEGQFTLAAGDEVTLMSRATDGTGELQIEEFSLPQPDGSTGWHETPVKAKSA